MSDDARQPERPYRLSAEQAVEAERSLLNNPDDLDVRTRLLIYYMSEGFRSKEARKAHLRHILQVIERYPDTTLAGAPYMHLRHGTDNEAIHEAKSLWMQQVAKYPESAAVKGNAAKFLLFASPQDWGMARDLLETAATLEPANPEWPEQSGRLAQFARTGENGLTAAQRALRYFERAYELTADKERKGLLLDYLADNAYAAEEFAKSADYATKLLQAAPLFEGGWNYGNALHWSHIILGKLALRQGDVETAKIHLQVAGDTPGSPQLNSFGPDFSLAQELLAQQEKEAVLAYCTACSKFWECGKAQLDAWIATMEQNQVPDFARSCSL